MKPIQTILSASILAAGLTFAAGCDRDDTSANGTRKVQTTDKTVTTTDRVATPASGHDINTDTSTAGDRTKDALNRAADATKRGLDKTGDALSNAADRTKAALTPNSNTTVNTDTTTTTTTPSPTR